MKGIDRTLRRTVDGAAGGFPKYQGHRLLVHQFADREGVVEPRHVLRRPRAPLEQQGVGAAERGRHATNIIVDIETRGAEHLLAARIYQAPSHPVAIIRAQRAHVEIQPVAGGGGEAVNRRLICRIQRAGHRRIQRDRRGVGKIGESEGKSTGLVADRIDGQLVITGDQIEHGISAA